MNPHSNSHFGEKSRHFGIHAEMTAIRAMVHWHTLPSASL